MLNRFVERGVLIKYLLTAIERLLFCHGDETVCWLVGHSVGVGSTPIGERVSFLRLLIALLLFGFSGHCWSQTVPDSPDRYRGDVAGARAQPDLDPLGIQIGSFNAHADGDTEIGYGSNIYDRSSDVIGDNYMKLRPNASLKGAWGGDAVDLDGRAQLTRFLHEKSQNADEYWAHASGKVDVGEQFTVTPTLEYSRATEPRGSSTNSFIAGTPVYDRTFSANVGVTYSGGSIFSTELLVAYRQQRFEPIELHGTEINQEIRDTDGVGGRAIFVTRLSPSISGLVEVVADTTHNPHRSFFDFRRAHGYGILSGIRIDPSGVIAGQISVGFRSRSFEGANRPSRGFTYDIRLQWYPTELLTATFQGNQQYRNSGIETASAVLVDEQTFDLAYEMYRDLNFYLEANREVSNYRGVNARTAVNGLGLRATYVSSRLLEVSIFARYETSKTNRPLIATGFTGVRGGISARVRI